GIRDVSRCLVFSRVLFRSQNLVAFHGTFLVITVYPCNPLSLSLSLSLSLRISPTEANIK
ncbi:hypothetical protein ACOSB0_00110, partial [Candidatus Phytoplasma citri]